MLQPLGQTLKTPLQIFQTHRNLSQRVKQTLNGTIDAQIQFQQRIKKP